MNNAIKVLIDKSLILSMYLLIVVIFLFVIKLLIKSIKKNLIKRKYLNSPLSKIDKMRGEEFERYLFYLFKERGYDVLLTPKVSDYGVDLLIYNKKCGKSMAIQAKRYKKKVGVSSVQEVVAGRGYYGCDESCVITNSYFTPNAVKLAKRNKTLLIDRDILKRYIDGERVKNGSTIYY